jgi:hypothetical protein
VRNVLNAMRGFPGGLRAPDLIVATDGLFPPIAPDILAALGDKRLFGVLIGFGDDGSHKEFDALFPVSGQIEPGDAARIINAMRKARGRKGRSAA